MPEKTCDFHVENLRVVTLTPNPAQLKVFIQGVDVMYNYLCIITITYHYLVHLRNYHSFPLSLLDVRIRKYEKFIDNNQIIVLILILCFPEI